MAHSRSVRCTLILLRALCLFLLVTAIALAVPGFYGINVLDWLGVPAPSKRFLDLFLTVLQFYLVALYLLVGTWAFVAYRKSNPLQFKLLFGSIVVLGLFGAGVSTSRFVLGMTLHFPFETFVDYTFAMLVCVGLIVWIRAKPANVSSIISDASS